MFHRKKAAKGCNPHKNRISGVFLLKFLTSATFEARNVQESVGLEQIVKIGCNDEEKLNLI